ncbi:MAG: hypothetical protein AVDCRST_MAG30-590, partial [uncultured Solirubrobacteraceae bacterium]
GADEGAPPGRCAEALHGLPQLRAAAGGQGLRGARRPARVPVVAGEGPDLQEALVPRRLGRRHVPQGRHGRRRLDRGGRKRAGGPPARLRGGV